MKKKNNNNLKKISAIFATALMAASAAGMSVSADSVQTLNAFKGTKTAKTASKTAKRAKSSNMTVDNENAAEQTIALTSDNNGMAKPGDVVEVAMTMNTNNTCVCYDLVVEYDARLELASVIGPKASCEYEENGRKFVSLVGFEAAPYKDGSNVVLLYFNVPKNAENDDYEVSFNQITSFSDEYEDYENYEAKNAVITVTGGVEKKETALELKNVTGLAGGSAVVQVVPTTGNRCTCYDMLVEYDPRLVLEQKDVAGANAFEIYEEDGRCFVSLVGYTADVYQDGAPMAALNFQIPYDASSEDTYEIKIAEVTSFSSNIADFDKYNKSNAVISVVTPKPGQKISEYKTFQKFAANGTLIGSMVGFRGDSNNDGKTNVRDAAVIANALAHHSGDIDEMGEFFGDVDDNGTLNVRDAARIAGYVAKGSTSWDK